LRLGEEALEAILIELAVLDADPVAPERVDPIGAEDLAQRADVTLNRVPRRGRRRRPPQRVHGLVDRYELACAQQKQCEQRPLLRA
jgi:hypothetical protein